MARPEVGLDFETYSGTDLTVHGLDRYVSDPTFKALIAGVAEEGEVPQSFDFVLGPSDVRNYLGNRIHGNVVVAHNAGFERAVLRKLGLNHLPYEIVDSAVSARVAGANGHLFQASRQLNVSAYKLDSGSALMKMFSFPGKYQETNGNLEFNPAVVYDHPVEWQQYKEYCWTDASAGLEIWAGYPMSPDEQSQAQITFRMNDIGWPVDRDAVEEMYARYLENQAQALNDFIVKHDAADFNIGSYPQKVKWCAERGIKAKSFDEKNVEKLQVAIRKKCESMMPTTDPKLIKYVEVLELLELLQVLGGSSPKKLKVILDTINRDSTGVWRLKDQYLHAGAGQTLRTTGRSVQMQNLKRLKDKRNMLDLFEPDEVWTNDELAQNIRQVFLSSHTDGELIVGDFSSIESRGLAFQAGAAWKLDAYRRGEDLYRLLAAKKWGITIFDVTEDQRQFGKVGELSCGYGAAWEAVKEFAEKMGVALTQAEAVDLVFDWRDLNPEVLAYWELLDRLIHEALNAPGLTAQAAIGTGGEVMMWTQESPASLRAQFPKARSLFVRMTKPDGAVYLERVFHGAHETGRNVRYFKASKSKTGDAWKNFYTDPKTKQMRFHEIYGGKMAGILTQSFCRELFFDQLHEVEEWSLLQGNIDLIGQFHDEVVLDWWPRTGSIQLPEARGALNSLMSNNKHFPLFPMAAEIKSAYRYTK